MELTKNKINYLELFKIIILAAVARVLVMLITTDGIYTMWDVQHFIIPWMENMIENGFWSMYKTVEGGPYAMDYPPLYYPLMYLFTGRLLPLAQSTGFWTGINIIKLFPVCLEIAGIIFIYFYAGAYWARYWAVCIPFIFDAALLGQSDCVYILEIIIFFYFLLKKENITLASVTYAIMACTKLQALMFLPIYLLAIVVSKENIRDKIKSVSIGILVGMLIWAPWLIVEGFELFFRIYLGGTTRRTLIAQNTGNIYLLNGLGILPQYATDVIFYNVLRIFTHIITIIILVLTYRKTEDILWSSFCYLFFVFFICPHQYIRYELYSFGVLMILYFLDYHKKYNFKGILTLSLIANAVQVSIDYMKDGYTFLPTETMNLLLVSFVFFVFTSNILILVRIPYITKQIANSKETLSNI